MQIVTTRNLNLLYNYFTRCNFFVQIADCTVISAQGYGSVKISNKLTLDGVLYVHNCTSNLTSVSSLVDLELLSII